jgi:hypothetical protein
MSKRMRTPQEKKRSSYAHDRRNTYGESSKASRKAIPAFKAATNRAMRHGSAQVLTKLATVPEAACVRVEAKLADTTWEGLHPKKRKSPDQPLGEVLAKKIDRRVAAVGDKVRRQKAIEAHKKREAEAYQQHLEKLARRKAMRQAARKAAARALRKSGQS